MHRGLEKDYRYLLSHIIPSRLLSSKRVEEIRSAVSQGDRLTLIRQAYLAMQELVVKGVMRREAVERKDGNVSLSYHRIDKPESITLVMSEEEWNRITGVEKKVGILSSVLAGIISSLSLNDSPRSVFDKLGEMLLLSKNIYPGSKAKVILISDVVDVEPMANETVRVLSWDDIAVNKLYRGALTSGMSHSFVRPGDYPGRVSVFPDVERTGSMLLIPITSHRIKWGVLEVHLPTESPPEVEVYNNFKILSQGIARLLENNKLLEKMTSFDRLTQVYNRNHYDIQLPLEIERANRTKKRLGFLMIDVDDFKRINDRYGHEIGDRVLREVARAIKGHLRKIDYLFRYGGEEFVALLPGADREAAMRTAERIRGVVADNVRIGDEKPVTISVGGCIYPDDAKDEQELFRLADRALYRSKNEGKNRVTFYSGD